MKDRYTREEQCCAVCILFVASIINLLEQLNFMKKIFIFISLNITVVQVSIYVACDVCKIHHNFFTRCCFIKLWPPWILCSALTTPPRTSGSRLIQPGYSKSRHNPTEALVVNHPTQSSKQTKTKNDYTCYPSRSQVSDLIFKTAIKFEPFQKPELGFWKGSPI